MHKTNPGGQVIGSFCDFCGKVWDQAGTEIMVEGHQGSLICLNCLSTAFASVVLHAEGAEHKGKQCLMCIEERDQEQWESPVNEGVRICRRCLKQSATALEKDPEVGWKRPGGEGARDRAQGADEDNE